jgi:hypothetical protein
MSQLWQFADGARAFLCRPEEGVDHRHLFAKTLRALCGDNYCLYMALLISIALAALGYVTGVIWFYIPIAGWGLMGLYYVFLRVRLAKSAYDLRVLQDQRSQKTSGAGNESGQGALEFIALLPLLAVLIGIIAFVVWVILQIF